ncbi:hypothetical protein IP84_12820 [beta proteobacterium AAP99]|nr:hypothetical protein IP84_12820 [beta proteobacterium AAP99]
MPEPAAAKASSHVLWLLTQDQQLIKVESRAPSRVMAQVRVQGLAPGEQLRAIDFRVARGQLYGLSNQGRLHLIDLASGRSTALPQPLGQSFDTNDADIDFNPAVDRIRIVNRTGQNLRGHPDTGAAAAVDPPLAYAPGDAQSGRTPCVQGAGYTYNKRDEKLTTNYAIDACSASLVTQGSVEGREPVVSPSTGQLFTVGALGLHAPLGLVSFDIADIDNAAYLLAAPAGQRQGLYRVDLASGRSTAVGAIAQTGKVLSLAIEP